MAQKCNSFDEYVKRTNQNLFVKIEKIQIKHEDFLKILMNEHKQMNIYIEKLEQIEQSNLITTSFVIFIKNSLDYGKQSPWWYLDSNNKTSFSFQAPEVYEGMITNYIYAREWLNQLKEDNII